MTDQPQADQNPEGFIQDAPMPSAEQQSSDQSQVEAVAPQETPANQETQEGLPTEVSERTRTQFEKVQNQLREERARREYAERMFQNLTPKVPEAPPEPPVWVDPNTGYLNEQLLNETQQRVIEAEKRAAEAKSQMESYLLEQEKKEAFSAHPELDPNTPTKFDKKLHNLTRSILTDSMLNPDEYGGKDLSFKQAADLAKTYVGKVLDTARQEGAQQALEQLSPKEQAALEATGSQTNRSSAQTDLSQLQSRTRKGDMNAVIERLKGIPWEGANR